MRMLVHVPVYTQRENIVIVSIRNLIMIALPEYWEFVGKSIYDHKWTFYWIIIYIHKGIILYQSPSHNYMANFIYCELNS